MAATPRKTHLPLIHEISALINFDRSGVGQLNFLLGAVPAGAVLTASHLLVTTPWNATTSQFFIGLAAGLGQLLSGADLKTVARTDPQAPQGACGPFPTDQQIWLAIVNTGPAPTAGSAVVYVEYLPGVG